MEVPHCVRCALSPRQTFVGPTARSVCRSVVLLGTVHVSVTCSPLRVARKSDGGFGKSSDGGCGGATLAHAVISNDTPRATIDLAVNPLMRKNRLTDLCSPPISLCHSEQSELE